MNDEFRWNPYADQPHNVDTRARRFVRHFRHLAGYLGLLGSNLRFLVPNLLQYRFHRKLTYAFPARIKDPFAVGITPVPGREDEIAALLKELDISSGLVRIKSWEDEELPAVQRFSQKLQQQGREVMYALLQRRLDVQDPKRWEDFLRAAFSLLGKKGIYFEVGHAWNRTKWGVWDYREYLRLAKAAEEAARDFPIRLVGPAVIDFEFHCYPPVLRRLDFDVVSSLLYVDRSGPPEAKQFGWNTTRKLALLRAVVDKCAQEGKPLWITEVNWPLADTGKYSPAAGRPNVSEEEQADYLVRYYVLCLCSGWVERIFWWQLVAPGYGLVDSRSQTWRKRPSFFALKTLKRFCSHSIYQGRFIHPQLHLFNFCKGREVFCIGWSEGDAVEYTFTQPISAVVSRSGEKLDVTDRTVRFDGSPRYIIFDVTGSAEAGDSGMDCGDGGGGLDG